MKRLFPMLYFLFFLSIILTLLSCKNNHFVSSGNLNFQGRGVKNLTNDYTGKGYVQAFDCIDKDNAANVLFYEEKFTLQIPCSPVRSTTNDTTLLLKTRFFINKIESPNLVNTAGTIRKNGTIIKIFSNIEYHEMLILPKYFHNNSSTGNCTTELTLTLVLDTNVVNPGDVMHVVFEILDEKNFHSHGTYDPVCTTHIPQCTNDFLANQLDRYICYELENCQEQDDLYIFKLIPICGPNNPAD